MAIQQLMLGVGAKDPIYLEDVFSTYVYRGNGNNNRDIVNNIDLSSKGGLVWMKGRSNNSRSHYLFDTERGTTKSLQTHESVGEQTSTNSLKTFNSNGYRIGNTSHGNNNNETYVSWTFAKQEKLMDIVTYTGNGNQNHVINHNLGVTPALIIIKMYSADRDWTIWHKDLTNTTSKYIRFNETSGEQEWENPNDSPPSTVWNNTAPTSSSFTVGTFPAVNQNGGNFVAYLFSDNQQIFGDARNQSIMKMGKYTGNGSEDDGVNVDLGWEPEFLMVKRRNNSADWVVIDSKRGWEGAYGVGNIFGLDTRNAEETGESTFQLTSTGFKTHTTSNRMNENGDVYIYWAIRRQSALVSKAPTLGTEVFDIDTGSGSSTIPNFDSGFPVDVGVALTPAASGQHRLTGARLLGARYLQGNTNSGAAGHGGFTYDSNAGWGNQGDGNTWLSYMWKRYGGFDVVHWESGGSNEAHTHSLGRAPEMIWVKAHSTSLWRGGHIGLNNGSSPWTYGLTINNDSAEFQEVGTFWNGVTPSSTSFTTGSASDIGGTSGDKYLALLFASFDGISKVGYYTGNGSSNTQTLGFQPRFIIIKRVDTTGDWIVLDTTRGWASGNDKGLKWNTTDAHADYDWADPTATGFTPNNDANTNNARYIYYAHA